MHEWQNNEKKRAKKENFVLISLFFKKKEQ